MHEAYTEHQVGYGRPFPPKYKDVFADRTNTGGELGLGPAPEQPRRRHHPDRGRALRAHGIKSFIVPLLTTANAEGTCAKCASARTFGDRVSAIVSLGYDSPGYGYGEKSDGVTPDLMMGLGAIARDYDVPYIVDNARAASLPGRPSAQDGRRSRALQHGQGRHTDERSHRRARGILDPVAACDRLAQRALRRAGNIAYGKGAHAIFDPGRETIVGQLAALEWLSATATWRKTSSTS